MSLHIYFCHNKKENAYFSTLAVLSSDTSNYISQTNYNNKFDFLEAALQIANMKNATLIEHRDTEFSEFWEYICK